MYILIFNAMRRRSVIADVIHLNAPGCPDIHTGVEWAQWVPGKSVLPHASHLYTECDVWCSYRFRGRFIPLRTL